jgi:very-short-patch-repair endonuclease
MSHPPHRFAGGGIRKLRRQSENTSSILPASRKHLVIEVDGSQHADNEADRLRTRWLEDQGFRVLRFWNNEVLKNASGPIPTFASR